MLAKGVYTVAPTPFNDDGSVDLDSVGRLANFLVELGVEGLVVLGVMGEANKLLGEERDAVLARFISEVNGRAAVVTGTSFPSAEGAARLTRQAEEMGADGVLLSPPRLAKPNPGFVREFYETVASGSSIEIVVQDHPASSGTHMSAELIAGLTDDIAQARSLKLEDPPTPPKFSAVLGLATRDLKAFGGLGGAAFLDELDRGAAGTMTGFAFPEVLVEIYRLYERGDGAAAREMFYRYLPVIVFEAQQPISLGMRKHTYRRRGVIATHRMRRPSDTPDEKTLDALDALLDELDLKVN